MRLRKTENKKLILGNTREYNAGYIVYYLFLVIYYIVFLYKYH